ncbi:hypothetical protein [Rhabdothermincola salaria]|uniref:hypothetical protein n=1 Tax=Rhabdothermincola salaria TaxID=2903142 RepID=UPI001E5E3495|nr:hypothetical protein [Rhabdothermincola salaria]MCD9625459.1 hypothetical protein [Rhabdothermincola salaria]
MKRSLAVAAAVVVLAVPLAACGDDDDSTTTTTEASGGSDTTEAPIGGDVLPPVILTPEGETSATVSVGTVVSFDMGDPGDGTFVAVSEDPSVFQVDGEGKVDGSATFNAGGTAVGEGTTEVSVSYRGSLNGMGTPTVFTITVE